MFGKRAANGVGRHVRRQIEQDVRVAVRLHLMMDGAGDHIARRQILPVGRILGHERPAVGREQHAALAAHRLADQEAFRAGRSQRGRVKLDVLGVDDARTRATGERQPITARAGRVGRVAVDATQPAGRQHGRGGQVAVDGVFVAVEKIRAVARDRAIGGQRIARVVREGDQIHRGRVGQDGDVRAAPQRGDQPGHDGLTRAIPHVENAPPRVGRLLAP